jgi:histidine triad (HIT) family protein
VRGDELPAAECPFCAIAEGRDTAIEFVAEGSGWLAFFPLGPATPGHTLIIPRTHVSDFWSADVGVVEELAVAAKRVGDAIQTALNPEGMNLITSAGGLAEQTVFHAHLHVVPRWSHDGFGPIWTPDGESYSDASLHDAAVRIRRAYDEGQ